MLNDRPETTTKLPCGLLAGPNKLLSQLNYTRTMARNNKTSNKAEGIIVLIIFLAGAFGAFYLFSGQEKNSSAPGQSLEAPAEMAQLETQDVYDLKK